MDIIEKQIQISSYNMIDKKRLYPQIHSLSFALSVTTLKSYRVIPIIKFNFDHERIRPMTVADNYPLNVERNPTSNLRNIQNWIFGRKAQLHHFGWIELDLPIYIMSFIYVEKCPISPLKYVCQT